MICDTSIFSKLTRLSANSSDYSFNQNEEEWDSHFDLIIRNLELSEDIITSNCSFKIFDQVTLKEIGKIDLPLKRIIGFQGEIKTLTLFFDLGNMFTPGFKAILHMKAFKKTKEFSKILNFDSFLRIYSEGNNKLIDPIYGYLYDLNISEKRHLKLLFLIFNQINSEILLPPYDEIKEFAQNYSFIKYQFWFFYLNKSSESIARSNRNLVKWTSFLEELVAFQADLLSEIEDKKGIANFNNTDPKNENYGNLLVSDSFIEKEARQILEKKSKPANKFSIFSSIFYLLDEWEKTSHGKWFYQNVQNLCKEGIPFVLREQFWLEFGKIKKLLFQTDRLINGSRSNSFDQGNNEVEIRKELFKKLLKQSKNQEMYGLVEFYNDLDQHQNRGFYNLTMREISTLKNIFQAFFCWKSLLNEKQYFYSKEMIPLVIKIIRFYRAEGVFLQEENVFWLFLTFVTTGLSNYFGFEKQEAKHHLNLSMNGIKADMFILELLVQEHLPKIYSKIRNFGLDLMHYFAKHFLSLFADFFNEEMCFRLWDILLFEGGAGGQVYFFCIFLKIYFKILILD